MAYGAAFQAAVLSGSSSKAIELVDVTPLSLGIEVLGGRMDVMIPRNSIIPTMKTKAFTTTEDDQETVDIAVFEGERPMTRDNHLLGVFELGGIPSTRRGTQLIEATFQLDENGILNVSATVASTGQQRSIRIVDRKSVV